MDSAETIADGEGRTRTETEGNTLTAAPEAWLGAAPHFVMMGTVAGHEFAVEVMDLDSEAASEAYAKREYVVKDGDTRFVEFEANVRLMVAEVEKFIELEIDSHDFSGLDLPATLDLQGEEFAEGAQARLEVGVHWIDGADEVEGWTGTLVLAHDSGEADEDGMVPDGMIGAFIRAERGEDSLVVSFTLPVDEYEVEEEDGGEDDAEAGDEAEAGDGEN
jgi:hypothetical protein